MNTEEGIKILFDEVDKNCKITKLENVLAYDNFTATLRTKLTNTGDEWGSVCNKWVEKFSNQTNSKWNVKSSYPGAQRLEYRKVYYCKESNSGCKGKINIKVKKDTIYTRKKDAFLKTGLNAEIKVRFAFFKMYFWLVILYIRFFR